jgi:hypothetical protein
MHQAITIACGLMNECFWNPSAAAAAARSSTDELSLLNHDV